MAQEVEDVVESSCVVEATAVAKSRRCRKEILLPASTPNLLCQWSPVSERLISLTLRVCEEVWGKDNGQSSTFIDLGCGDGRVVTRVCQAFNTCRGVGVDLNRELIDTAIESAQQRGVEDRCDFKTGDMVDVDLSPATIVFLYLPANALRLLVQRVFPRCGLRPGAIILSADGPLGNSRSIEPLGLRRTTIEGRGLHGYIWRGTTPNKKGVPPEPCESPVGNALYRQTMRFSIPLRRQSSCPALRPALAIETTSKSPSQVDVFPQIVRTPSTKSSSPKVDVFPQLVIASPSIEPFVQSAPGSPGGLDSRLGETPTLPTSGKRNYMNLSLDSLTSKKTSSGTPARKCRSYTADSTVATDGGANESRPRSRSDSAGSGIADACSVAAAAAAEPQAALQALAIANTPEPADPLAHGRTIAYLREVYKDNISGFGNDHTDQPIDHNNLQYGEITYEGMEPLYKAFSLTPEDVFYDLGSGVAKLVIYVGLRGVAAKSVGVEVGVRRHGLAVIACDRAHEELRNINQDYDEDRRAMMAKCKPFEAVLGDVRKNCYKDATVVNCSNLCMDQQVQNRMLDNLMRLPALRRLVVIAPLPARPRLKLVKAVSCACTWAKIAQWHVYDVLPMPELSRPERDRPVKSTRLKTSSSMPALPVAPSSEHKPLECGSVATGRRKASRKPPLEKPVRRSSTSDCMPLEIKPELGDNAAEGVYQKLELGDIAAEGACQQPELGDSAGERLLADGFGASACW